MTNANNELFKHALRAVLVPHDGSQHGQGLVTEGQEASEWKELYAGLIERHVKFQCVLEAFPAEILDQLILYYAIFHLLIV